MRTFRFGVNSQSSEGHTWVEACRTVEEQGYDVLLVPDHLGGDSPFGLLTAAALATSRLRLGTYVLNNEFWNPALLAREVAGLDRISGGRFELGLGAGHMKSEFDDAGIAWRPRAERTARLASSLDELDRRLREGGQEPQPVQRPRPPLLVGGHGVSTLTLAAERADIVAFSGLIQRPGHAHGVFGVAGVEQTLERVELVRAAAGERDHESSVLMQMVLVTDDVERTADEIRARAEQIHVHGDEPLWENPYLLMGTPEEMARALVERRNRFGFTHVVTHGPFQDALAQVIPVVRELEHGDSPPEAKEAPK